MDDVFTDTRVKETLSGTGADSTEPHWKLYSEVQRSYLQKNVPMKVFIELTYKCNFRCPHCYVQEDLKTTDDFPGYAKVISLIDQMRASGVFDLNITGGEATMHPRFLDILKYASGKMPVTLLTNGILLSEELMFDKILDIPLLDVRVSVYGRDSRHDVFVNQNGAFQKSFKTLKNLRKYKGIGTAVFVVTKDNFCDIPLVRRLMDDEGIDLDIVTTINPTARGDKSPLALRISPEEYKYILDNYSASVHGSLCSAGISRFRVSPSGDVNPCELMREISFGNAYEKSWKNVMNEGSRLKWVDDFKGILKAQACNSCDFRKNCNFCPALAYLENGSYDMPIKYVCEASKMKNDKMREENITIEMELSL